MLKPSDARVVMKGLIRTLGRTSPQYMEDSSRIPRPILLPKGEGWRGHPIPEAMTPSIGRRSPIAVHEIFLIFVEQHIVYRDATEHPFTYVANAFQVADGDRRNLFPTRYNHRGGRDDDTLYAIAILLLCANVAGFNLLYGKDWAIATLDGVTLGVEYGKTVCGDPAFCVPVDAFDWQAVYESPRESGTINAPELGALYKRSRNKSLPNQEEISQAVSTLAWAAGNPTLLATNYYFEDATTGFEEHITRNVMKSKKPIQAMRQLLVPTFVPAKVYNQITDPYRLTEPFWSDIECREFVDNVLTLLALKSNNKNKKGKSHVDSTHRQGAGR